MNAGIDSPWFAQGKRANGMAGLSFGINLDICHTYGHCPNRLSIRNANVDIHKLLLVFSISVLLTACGSSPEKQKAKAEARQTEEQTKTMQEYKACVKKAKTDQDKLDACERMLKAIQ